MLQGITREFGAAELLEIQQQLGGRIERWLNDSFDKAAIIIIDSRNRNKRAELKLFFEQRLITVAQHTLDELASEPTPADYVVSLFKTDKVLYHQWASGGPGVEFFKTKEKDVSLVRIFSDGRIQVKIDVPVEKALL